jgi:hypothetical protein
MQDGTSFEVSIVRSPKFSFYAAPQRPHPHAVSKLDL